MDFTKEKTEMKRQQIEAIKEDRRQISTLIKDGQIDFTQLPVISPRVREILLGWISNALEDSDKRARTEEGLEYRLEIAPYEHRCVIHCEDGNMTMQAMKLIFDR